MFWNGAASLWKGICIPWKSQWNQSVPFLIGHLSNLCMGKRLLICPFCFVISLAAIAAAGTCPVPPPSNRPLILPHHGPIPVPIHIHCHCPGLDSRSISRSCGWDWSTKCLKDSKKKINMNLHNGICDFFSYTKLFPQTRWLHVTKSVRTKCHQLVPYGLMTFVFICIQLIATYGNFWKYMEAIPW